MNCPSSTCAWHKICPISQHKPTKLTDLFGALVLLSPFAVFAQDVSVGSPAESSGSPQTSVIQRVEIVARQGSTELRRAASFAKQIYGREELDRYGDTNALDVMRRCERGHRRPAHARPRRRLYPNSDQR